MNKLTISLTIFAMALGGCGDDDRDGDDTITLMDSGPATDMGTGTDLGTGTDGGGTRSCEQPLPNLVDLNMDPMAMGMLLPRCEAATVDCVNACEDLDCQTACLQADTTPSVDIGAAQPLDCELCFNVQFNSCLFDACPTQGADFLCCTEDQGCSDINNCPACGTESDAFSACAMPAASGCFTADYLAACFAM